MTGTKTDSAFITVPSTGTTRKGIVPTITPSLLGEFKRTLDNQDNSEFEYCVVESV